MPPKGKKNVSFITAWFFQVDKKAAQMKGKLNEKLVEKVELQLQA